ncbi:KTSC domain-containing protein [Beggiatoa leptomitoformis]|uniref:KTSC domain-containing protein n=1 Tax=Beggiatoa leptomitoformis TaxID=288004 RepID=A0A2N9YJ38_9GAMM|nr:KTSC domain-containing protein [Beggiatoa leptomitoformis]AUI70504.1 KTSC domain-containing protein [Beggiatoa leptomitoformis]
MHRQIISSSAILAISYDATTEILEVEFHDGTVYEYHKVSKGIYDDFMRASSKGTFFNDRIRDAYTNTRL